jgi:uncharacterized membrane protein YphA (DoxX/SURF4 family)
MRTRDVATILLLVALGLVLLVAGCAQLDEFFTPDPVTGVSPANEAGDTIRDVGRSVGLTPWGEIGAGILGLVGAGYLLFRKIQRVRAGKVPAK